MRGMFRAIRRLTTRRSGARYLTRSKRGLTPFSEAEGLEGVAGEVGGDELLGGVLDLEALCDGFV